MTHTTNNFPAITSELMKQAINNSSTVTHLIAGVGTGKTYNSVNLTDTRVLFLAPTNIIKSQTVMAHGQTYTASNLGDAILRGEAINGVTSYEALIIARNRVEMARAYDSVSSDFYDNLKDLLDVVILDEIHLAVSEASYRRSLGEVITGLRRGKFTTITLTATPIKGQFESKDTVYVVESKVVPVTTVNTVILPTKLGEIEVTKEMTAKAYAKAGLTDGKLLESGKYEVTTIKQPKTPTGFIDLQKVKAVTEIIKTVGTKAGIIIYSENSADVNRKMVKLINEATDANITYMDRAGYDKADLITDRATQEAQYPFMKIYSDEQVIGQPLMVTAIGKQGLNLLDTVYLMRLNHKW